MMKRLVVVLKLAVMCCGGCCGQPMLHEDVRDGTVMWGWDDPFGFAVLRQVTNDVSQCVTGVVAGAGIEVQRTGRAVQISAVADGMTTNAVKDIVGGMGAVTNGAAPWLRELRVTSPETDDYVRLYHNRVDINSEGNDSYARIFHDKIAVGRWGAGEPKELFFPYEDGVLATREWVLAKKYGAGGVSTNDVKSIVGGMGFLTNETVAAAASNLAAQAWAAAGNALTEENILGKVLNVNGVSILNGELELCAETLGNYFTAHSSTYAYPAPPAGVTVFKLTTPEGDWATFFGGRLASGAIWWSRLSYSCADRSGLFPGDGNVQTDFYVPSTGYGFGVQTFAWETPDPETGGGYTHRFEDVGSIQTSPKAESPYNFKINADVTAALTDNGDGIVALPDGETVRVSVTPLGITLAGGAVTNVVGWPSASGKVALESAVTPVTVPDNGALSFGDCGEGRMFAVTTPAAFTIAPPYALCGASVVPGNSVAHCRVYTVGGTNFITTTWSAPR